MESAFTVAYVKNIPFEIFLIESDSPEQSKEILDRYIKTVSQENILKKIGDQYEINDAHNGPITIVRVKNYLCGIMSCNDEQIRNEYLEEIYYHLTK